MLWILEPKNKVANHPNGVVLFPPSYQNTAPLCYSLLNFLQFISSNNKHSTKCMLNFPSPTSTHKHVSFHPHDRCADVDAATNWFTIVEWRRLCEQRKHTLSPSQAVRNIVFARRSLSHVSLLLFPMLWWYSHARQILQTNGKQNILIDNSQIFHFPLWTVWIDNVHLLLSARFFNQVFDFFLLHHQFLTNVMLDLWYYHIFHIIQIHFRANFAFR